MYAWNIWISSTCAAYWDKYVCLKHYFFSKCAMPAWNTLISSKCAAHQDTHVCLKLSNFLKCTAHSDRCDILAHVLADASELVLYDNTIECKHCDPALTRITGWSSASFQSVWHVRLKCYHFHTGSGNIGCPEFANYQCSTLGNQCVLRNTNIHHWICKLPAFNHW